jgi:hypothetical protein
MTTNICGAAKIVAMTTNNCGAAKIVAMTTAFDFCLATRRLAAGSMDRIVRNARIMGS